MAAANIKPDLLRVQKQLTLSLFNLKYMTGIPEHTPLTIKGELNYTQHPVKEAELIKQALTNASEIRQMKLQMKKAHNLLKIAYAQFIPDISLVGAYSYRADAFRFTEKNWENYYTINLAFRFPLFTGLKRSAKAGEIKVMKKILGLDFQQLNDALKLQIKNQCLTLGQEYENIQTGLKNIETAAEGVRIARLNYDEGLVSILELNSSMTEQTRAKVQFLQAVYNYTIAAAELEKITGLPIAGGEQ